jgi:hypothetical protein
MLTAPNRASRAIAARPQFSVVGTAEQPDEATVRTVVLNPSHRLVAASVARETHNNNHNSGRKQPRPRNANSLQGLRLV